MLVSKIILKIFSLMINELVFKDDCCFENKLKSSRSWRQEFSSHSATNPLAPWGFVQLG